MTDEFPMLRTLTVSEAAQILGMSRNGAYAAIKRGDIPSVRFGCVIRIPVVALERMIAGGVGAATKDCEAA